MVERCLKKVHNVRWEPEDILDAIRERDMQLWAAVDAEGLHAILITRLVRYPRVLECELFIWSGRMTDGWRQHLEVVEQWAREQGCHYMTSMSRRGSAKVVGYTQGLVHTYKGL